MIIAQVANLEWLRILIHEHLDDLVENDVKPHCIELSSDLT